MSLGLECVYPSVPRVRHLMTQNHSTASFALSRRLEKYPIQLTAVDLGDLTYLIRTNYDSSLLTTFLQGNFSLLTPFQSLRSWNFTQTYRSDVIFLEAGRDELRRVTLNFNCVYIIVTAREVLLFLFPFS